MRINNILGYNPSQSLPQNRINTAKPITFLGGLKVNNSPNTDVVRIFKKLASIPSPPLGESKVADWIMDFCEKYKIKAEFDNYRNIRISIPGTDSTKRPLLLSAHMDVVGDNSKVNLVTEGEYIKTDGKRTLGADDKAGIAVALKLAKEIIKKNFKHGGLEMLFTRDEELGLTGIKNVDFKTINSKYVLVLDEARFGNFDTSGAGFTTANLSVRSRYGGHSGMDIGDKKRINAARALNEILSEIPEGICYNDGKGTVASINTGTIIAGDIENSTRELVEQQIPADKHLDYMIKNAVTNVINTKADAALSLRSSSKELELKLRQFLLNIVKNFNQKNKGLAEATLEFDELIPIFEKSEDSTMEKVYQEACKELELKPSVGSFPAAAETHIIAYKKNKNNEPIIPSLLGIADIYNMHSAQEQINFISLKKGYELLKEMFFKFNS